MALVNDANSITEERYEGYAVAELRKAFDAVKNPSYWKGPIAALVGGEAVDVVVKAIMFYTATVPTIALDMTRMQYVITSIGYQAGPAGDH